MNESSEKDTDTKEDEAVYLKEEIVFLKAALETLTDKLENSKNEIDTLKLIMKSLTSGSGSKTHKTDPLAFNTDSSKDNTDTPPINTDTTTVSTDTPAINTDTPPVDTDTPINNTDTPPVNTDTPAIGTDTSKVNTDAPGIKIPEIQAKKQEIQIDDPVVRRRSLPYKQKRAAVRKYIKNLRRDVSAIFMKTSEEISSTEITRLLEYWKKRPSKAYDSKVKIDKSLNTLNSFITNKQESISDQLKKEIEWEKIVLSIKKEILTGLKKKDMVRFQTNRLVKALFYLKEKSPVDMKTLIADLKIPRITVCRELKIFRNFGWSRTTGRGPTARYSLTDEGRKYISTLMGEKGF